MRQYARRRQPTILDGAPQHSQIRTSIDVVVEDHALLVAARIHVEDTSLNLFTRLARHTRVSRTEPDSAPVTLNHPQGGLTLQVRRLDAWEERARESEWLVAELRL
jgi:hypothetical protein